MSFFNVYLPANAESFYTIIIEMSEFNFIDTEKIIDQIIDTIFPFLDSDSEQISGEKNSALA